MKKNKKPYYIGIVTFGILTMSPILIMAYGMILGHSYSSNQLGSAVVMGVIGIMTVLFSSMVVSEL